MSEDRKSLVTNVRPARSKIVRARDCIIHANNLLHVYWCRVSVSVVCYFIMLLQHGLSAVSKSKMEKTLRVLKSALKRRQFVSWLKMDARQV